MAGLGANKSTLDAEVDDIMGESKPGETQLGPAASFCSHGTAAMTGLSLTNGTCAYHESWPLCAYMRSALQVTNLRICQMDGQCMRESDSVLKIFMREASRARLYCSHSG